MDISQRQLLRDIRKKWQSYSQFLAKKLAYLPLKSGVTREDQDQEAGRLTESMNSAFNQVNPPILVEEGDQANICRTSKLNQRKKLT